MIDSVEVLIRRDGQPDAALTLRPGATRIGRANDNECVLADVGVSRRHAQIYVGHDSVVVEDLGSGNGTYFQGKSIQSQLVQDRDEIAIDPFVLEFRIRMMSTASQLPAGPLAHLVLTAGQGAVGTLYPIGVTGMGIGRAEDQDVVLSDPAASRAHCRISVENGSFILRDLGSANGLFVNGKRTQQQRLDAGDLISIGNTDLRFHEANPSDQSTESRTPHIVGRRHRGPQHRLAAWFGGVMAFCGVLVAVGALGAFLWAAVDAARTSRATQVGWTLQAVPFEGSIDEAFERARTAMQDGQPTRGFELLYFVASTRPDYPSVDKFLFAAGEEVAFQALQEAFEASAQERAKQEARKHQLIKESKSRSRSVARSAYAALKSEFQYDPDLQDRYGWPASKEQKAFRDALTTIENDLAEGNLSGAHTALAPLIDATRHAADRSKLMSAHRSVQRAIAVESRRAWAEAIATCLNASPTKVRDEAFERLRQDVPHHPRPAHLTCGEEDSRRSRL